MGFSNFMVGEHSARQQILLHQQADHGGSIMKKGNLNNETLRRDGPSSQHELALLTNTLGHGEVPKELMSSIESNRTLYSTIGKSSGRLPVFEKVDDHLEVTSWRLNSDNEIRFGVPFVKRRKISAGGNEASRRKPGHCPDWMDRNFQPRLSGEAPVNPNKTPQWFIGRATHRIRFRWSVCLLSDWVSVALHRKDHYLEGGKPHSSR